MGIFRQIGNAMARFMYGRNGMDQLNRALLWVYLAAYLIRVLFMRGLQSSTLSLVGDVVMYAFAVLILFRMFSRNLYKRREENQKWMNWWWRVKNRTSGARARHADKAHKYFTCKSCKTICRVPVGKGRIVITCPKCGSKIQAKS